MKRLFGINYPITWFYRLPLGKCPHHIFRTTISNVCLKSLQETIVIPSIYQSVSIMSCKVLLTASTALLCAIVHSSQTVKLHLRKTHATCCFWRFCIKFPCYLFIGNFEHWKLSFTASCFPRWCYSNRIVTSVFNCAKIILLRKVFLVPSGISKHSIF